jgi:hypothetical protein
MNMKKLIQKMTDIEQGRGRRNLKESYDPEVAECGDMGPMSAPAPMPAQENPGNPVTASITLNASGMQHVSDLMRLLQQAGLDKAGPVSAPVMPMRMDMENLRDKMNSLEAPSSIDSRPTEDWSNEPEEEYRDHNYMLDDLAGGINKPKKMYKPAAKGDNPMAVESDDEDDDEDNSVKKMKESIKATLYKALSEKKSKPDFLDMDKDGDRKEPMKKALKDKKVKEASRLPSKIAYDIEKASEKSKEKPVSLKKAPWDKKKEVDEAAKPDFLDMDKDGDRKEPMKKALADKKKKPVSEKFDDYDDFDDAWVNSPDKEKPRPDWMDKPNLRKGPGAKWKQGLDKTGNRYQDSGDQGGYEVDITKDPRFRDTGDTLDRPTRKANTINKKIQMKYDLDNTYPGLKRNLGSK